MLIRFKAAWRSYRVGSIICPSAMTAGWLITNGFAERVQPEALPAPIAEPPPAPELAAVSAAPEPEAEAAFAPQGRKRGKHHEPRD